VRSKNQESTSATGNPEYDEEHDQADHRVRNIEYRKNLRNTFRQRPATDRIRDRDSEDIAPLQFIEEFSRIHGCLPEAKPLSALFHEFNSQ